MTAQPEGREGSGSRYIAITGGVGGAKLVLGLNEILGERLTVIVNSGDDFEHLGLTICPDFDTTLYTLAGLVNPETGWGRAGETWSFMAATAELGGATWFKLGDRDLALHVERTRRLRAGESLSSVGEDVRRRLGVAARLLPMSDDAVRTLVDTPETTLAFQEYFVREQCRPVARRVHFEGAKDARPLRQALEALADPRLAGVIICPSNPYLSIDPILAVPGFRQAIAAAPAPVIAVTPIIDGKAIKGPTAKIMTELGVPVTAAAVARHYDGLIDGFVADERDRDAGGGLPVEAFVADTLMVDLPVKMALARTCVEACRRLARSGSYRERAGVAHKIAAGAP